MNTQKFNRQLLKLKAEAMFKGYYENMGQDELRLHDEWLQQRVSSGKLSYQEYVQRLTAAQQSVDSL